MKKKLLIVGMAILFASLVFGTITSTQAAAVSAKIKGKVTANKNSVVNFNLTNGYAGTKLKNVVIWVPTGWTIAYPASNVSLRTGKNGPWSTLIKWNGASLRSGYNAIWYKNISGTGIGNRKSETFQLTLKTPTNRKMNGQKVKIYWQADDGKGHYFRGYTYLFVK